MMQDQPIKTALASFGMSGQVFHAPLLSASKDFSLEMILERSKKLSRKLYPNATIARSFEELCKNEAIELVVINTPDHTHYQLTQIALAYGKNVVVEKPFTQNYRQAMELAELADKKGLLLSVFQNRRWDGDFLTVQKVIGEQMLGRLVSYEAHFDRYRKHIQPGTWKEDVASGTGTLFNLGSHLIDQALVLFGNPVSVFADIRTLREGGKVDDSFDVWMEYPHVKVIVRGSYLVREPGPRYILHGTEGSFLKWGIDPQEEALKQGKTPGLPNWGKDAPENHGILHTTKNGNLIREHLETIPGDYPAFYKDMFRALRRNQEPAVTASQAAMGIRIIEAAFESKKQKRAIAV